MDKNILEPSYKGKVRDVYDLGDQLLLSASDRVSAFDFVFKETFINKGKILTNISNHWFSLIDQVPNHTISNKVSDFPKKYQDPRFEERTVLVHKAKRIDYECIVRGYLMGSGYKDYLKNQKICGVPLPTGLQLGSKLPNPIFTPTTKSDIQDKPITYDELSEKIGIELASTLRDISINLFEWANKKLEKIGIILLDTKLEFGMIDNKISLIDEVFTPDSSRFCKIEEYKDALIKKQSPPSYDKQVLRDYLESISWDKKPPIPSIPNEIIEKTLAKYKEIEEKILCLS